MLLQRNPINTGYYEERILNADRVMVESNQIFKVGINASMR
jgi:hypothetical protein